MDNGALDVDITSTCTSSAVKDFFKFLHNPLIEYKVTRDAIVLSMSKCVFVCTCSMHVGECVSASLCACTSVR